MNLITLTISQEADPLNPAYKYSVVNALAVDVFVEIAPTGYVYGAAHVEIR